MSFLDSINRSIKNIFVGSHKGDDIKEEWINPLDKMPVANGTNKYHPDPNYDPPRPEEEIADWFIEEPDESDEIEQEKKTIHQKLYEIATAKYNPFAIGGSEKVWKRTRD